MGVPNLGGPLVTAGGVAFLSGSMDDYVRAYDMGSGQQLWEARLPAGGQATPMTYSGEDGRQYLLVVAGGPMGRRTTKAGDSVDRVRAAPRTRSGSAETDDCGRVWQPTGAGRRPAASRHQEWA